jgi:hypothetical protein
MNKEQAAMILGVKIDTKKDIIEKKYNILFKKFKKTIQTNEDKAKFKEIIEAYNVLMEYDSLVIEEKPPKEIYKKLGLDQKKTENFLHYYKAHIIIGIIILIVAFFTVKSIVNNVKPELEITIMGDIYVNDVELLQDMILEKMPDIPKISVVHVPLFDSLPGDQLYAYQMKAQIQFAAASVDIFILDEKNYRRYASMGAFKPIEDIAKDMGIDIKEHSSLNVVTEEESKERLYGLEIPDSELMNELRVKEDDRIILSVGHRGEFPENGLRFIELVFNK